LSVDQNSLLSGAFLLCEQRWNHEDLRNLNPGVELPDQEVRVVYPSSSSGVETDALYQLLKSVPLFNSMVHSSNFFLFEFLTQDDVHMVQVANASSMYSFIAVLNTSVATSGT
jgi:hypothetical protein